MLSTLLRNTLGVLTTEESLIAPMTALLARIHPSEDEYTQIVLETMSDVKDVLEQYEQPEVQEMLAAESERLRANEAQLAKLARRGITEEDADAAVQDLVAETAELRAKEELRAQLEEGTWLRCMSLASTLMQNTTKSTADPRIGGLLPAILLAVRNANPAVREAGVRAPRPLCTDRRLGGVCARASCSSPSSARTCPPCASAPPRRSSTSCCCTASRVRCSPPPTRPTR
jgi:hypothetical protein